MTQAPLKPVYGVTPEYVTSMVNQDIVEQHIDEAAFLWLEHQHAISRPDYSLADIEELDCYLDANLKGIWLAGETGWQMCLMQLTEGREYLFPAAIMALRRKKNDCLQRVLTHVDQESADIFIGALGWLEYAQVKPHIDELLTDPRPFYRYLGVSACGLHRQTPSVSLEELMKTDIPLLKARVIQLAGELKYRHQKHDLIGYLHSSNNEYRFRSAWSLALMGERYYALPVLETYLSLDSAFRLPALQMVMRLATPDGQKRLIYTLAKKGDLSGAVIATGIAGYARSVPWLIKMMEYPHLSRLAGEAFSMITGVDIGYNDLDSNDAQQEDDAEDEQEEEMDDYEEDLPVPDPALTAEWWRQYQRHFQNEGRYLAGKRISDGNLFTVLQTGLQRQRQAAAMELALMQPDYAYLETRVRGAKQRRYGAGGKA